MQLSVVIPAYNASALILATIQSVLDPGGIEMEVIVVDDGSTDDLKGTLGPLVQSGEVKLIRQPNSGSPASPRNKGLGVATGEFVLFLDADDIVVSKQVRLALQLLEAHPDVSMICGNYNITDAHLNVTVARNIDRYTNLQAVLERPIDTTSWLICSRDAVRTLVKTNFVGTCSVIARKSALDRVGGFDESLKNLDDRDMWIRLAQVGPIIYRSDVFFFYRNVSGSVSKQRQFEQFLERVRVAEKVLSNTHDQEIRKEARKWKAKSLLKIGYILFHEQGNRMEARSAFSRSFASWPTFAAFKGVIKSLLPARLYQLVVRSQ